MISAKRSSSTIITAGNAATPRHADPSKQTTSPISPSARKRKWTPTINVENTKHSVVLRAGEGIGLAATTSPTDWTIQWQDGVVTVDQLLHMRPWQRINHFPAMHHLCHKDYLARNLTKMRNEFPHEYAFWPRTWCMRTDAVAFTAFAGARARARAARGRPPRWYIAKPDSKSRGIGIYLFSDPAEFQTNPEYEMVVQQYIERPLLIEGYKFDMRVYALITQCDPLRLFVYKEGLARFATEPYGSGPALDNQAQICMHLTNYSVNKRSTKFVDGGADGGSKRTLTWALEYLDSLGHDGTGAIWTSIKDIIAKSILTVQPELARVFRTCTPNGDGSLCFELLGFDVILDHKLRPFVLEINHSPSLSCETAVDHTLKQGLLENIFGLLNPTSLNPRKWMRRDRKQAKQRLYAGSNTTAAGASPLAATSLAPKPVAAPTVVDNDPDADSADEADDSPAPPLLPLNPSPAPPAATDDCSPSDPLDAATAYETAHLGLFERVYPPSDPATAERYATYLTTAQSLFVVAETAATRARKEAVRANLADTSKPHLPPIRKPAATAAVASSPRARSRPSAAKLPRTPPVVRPRPVAPPRATLSMSVSNLGAILPETGGEGYTPMRRASSASVGAGGASAVMMRGGGKVGGGTGSGSGMLGSHLWTVPVRASPRAAGRG